MKTKIAFAAFFMIFNLIRVSGQSAPVQPMDEINISRSGPPTFETTTSGIEIKVWVMTQEEHDRMMKQMNGQMMSDNDQMTMDNDRMKADKDQKKMDKDQKKADKDQKKMEKSKKSKSAKEQKKTMTGSTHHIKVELTDAATGMIRNDVDAKVEITSPSKKNTWIDLKNMSDHYGQDLILKEKGSYSFIVRIDDKGFRKSAQFNYTVD